MAAEEMQMKAKRDVVRNLLRRGGCEVLCGGLRVRHEDDV